MSFDVISKATPKRDGADKVTGHTQFLHDLTLPRLAHGAILRTQYPDARVLRPLPCHSALVVEADDGARFVPVKVVTMKPTRGKSSPR